MQFAIIYVVVFLLGALLLALLGRAFYRLAQLDAEIQFLKWRDRVMSIDLSGANAALARVQADITKIAEDVRRLAANQPDPNDQTAVNEFTARLNKAADDLDAVDLAGGDPPPDQPATDGQSGGGTPPAEGE